MPLTNAYCLVSDIRGELGDTGTKLDLALLEKAVNASSRAVDRWCSGGLGVVAPRRFWRDAAPTVRMFAVDEPTLAWVEDIASPTGVIVKTDDDADGVYETTWTAGVDYHLAPLNVDVAAPDDTATPYAFWQIAAIGTRGFPRFSRRAGLQVTAEFGWSSIPEEVKAATILKAVSLFRRKDAPFGVAGVTDFGPVRISRTDPDVIDLLREYRKIRSRTLQYGAQRRSLFHRSA